ncbi:MAG: hypothetical protein Q9170_004013, partial [Blastenia crenularia]
MERSAKRISSIFSIGSNFSEKSSSTSSTLFSQPSQSSRASSPPRKPLPIAAKTYPTSVQELQTESEVPAKFGPTLSPPLTGNDDGAFPDGVYKPLPERSASPAGSARGRAGSAPGTRSSSPFKGFLRPLTPVSDIGGTDSRFSSQPGSRTSSPHKDFHRPFTPVSDASRPSSRGNLGGVSRPHSPSKQLPGSTPLKEKRISRRRSWIPGRSRMDEPVEKGQLSGAWIMTASSSEKPSYDLSPLVNFQQVPELWKESGDVTVFLHAKEAHRGPSFRVDSSILAASRKLTSMAYSNVSRTQTAPRTLEHQVQNTLQLPDPQSRRRPSLPDQFQNMTLQLPDPSSKRRPSLDGSSQGSRTRSNSFDDAPLQNVNLYLPLPLHADLASVDSGLDLDDTEQVIVVRNVFAFLTNQPLVATAKTPNAFEVFLKIADFIQRYEFSNLDGSTLGEEVATNFKEYATTFKLADVRTSREKTIEAIILGERMRSLNLYNEGFVHGVGKYDEIVKLKSPKYHMITDTTAKRLERATLDLNLRLKTVRTRLESFDFPSLFAGIANSTTSTESKTVRFKAWKASFLAMRRHVIAFYRGRYGAWPPSAKSKKNEFGESGLNRILLQEVYRDFSDLYDVLVNRAFITTRSAEVASPIEAAANEEDVTAPALRRVMDEYDRSSPPVQPPVPFDTPLLPSLESSRRGFESLDPKKQKRENSKSLENDEINLALMQSYDRDSINSTDFLEAFMNFERQVARGKSIEEMQDLRNGQWLFMYAVLQSLPLVIVDAPGIQWTSGVEYFLCEVPKGSPPWIQECHSRGWYAVTGSTGVVSLPADIIDHGVDGIYRRSHCWKAAEKWSGYNDLAHAANHASTGNVLTPPEALSSDVPGSRSNSPSRIGQRGSVHLGLEALPLPAGVAPSGAKPLVARHNPLKSFEDILGEPAAPKGKK